MWDPRGRKQGDRNPQLVQMIDMPATLLEHFGVGLPPDMQGQPLRETLAAKTPVRKAGLFGTFGGHVNCTDGRYVYMRAPAGDRNEPLYNYTLMPTHMRRRFSPEELQPAELAGPFAFTKGCPVLRTPGKPFMQEPCQLGTLLFDLQDDPRQENPIQDPEVEQRMIGLMTGLMQENGAPPEQFTRLGLAAKGSLRGISG